MKHPFHFLFIVFSAAFSVASCVESTDIDQLYKESYGPQFSISDLYGDPIISTATSISFSGMFNYPAKVKQVLCTIGQNPDSVSQRLGRTVAFKPESTSQLNQVSTYRIDSLMPKTQYYCNVYFQDYANLLFDGFMCEKTTQSIGMQFVWEQGFRDQKIYFTNISPNAYIGYRYGYKSDMSDATTHLQRAQVYSVTSPMAEVTFYVRDIMPNTTIYIQPMVKEGGHLFYGEIIAYDKYRFNLRASAEPGLKQTKIILEGNFSYGDSSLGFNVGFYFADHTITESNLGKRYASDISYYASETQIDSLKPNTTYYVRPFIAKGDRQVLFDEYSFTTRKGFDGDVCDIDVAPTYEPDKHCYIRFIRVEPGTFTMGATPAQIPYADPDEYPAHQVTIDYPFYIAETELTDGQHNVVQGWSPDDGIEAKRLHHSDALEFIGRLNDRMELKGFRLPTEAEWEYAARGGHKANGDWIYAGSNDYTEVSFFGDSIYEYQTLSGDTVKTKAPNALGLYDMSGNAAEWCSDRYDPDYYATSPSLNPTGSRYGDFYVVRGGDHSPYHPVTNRRVSKRSYANDYTYGKGANSYVFGLRLIYDPSLDNQ